MSEEIREEIISWIKCIVSAVVFAYLITNFVIVNAAIPSSSMEKTIMTGDRAVAWRLSYLLDEPERFDIVVFIFPDDGETLFVKRIVGLPGETVNVVEGKVYINDSTEPLEDWFINGEDFGRYRNAGTFVVPEGHYFMMGDNRGSSFDSRGWEVSSYVAEDKILGKVIFKYYKGIGLIK